MSEWQDIETAPSLRSIWVSTKDDGYGSGLMEPCYRVDEKSPWKNTYTLQRIDWEPTHWMTFPRPPVPTHNPEKEE